LAAVDVHDLPGDERGVLEVDDRVGHVADLAHPAERVQRGQGLVRLGRVHRGADDAEREGVDPDAAVRVLGRQRPGDRGQAARVRDDRVAKLAVGGALIVRHAGAMPPRPASSLLVGAASQALTLANG
jgi:hypothetical protein